MPQVSASTTVVGHRTDFAPPLPKRAEERIKPGLLVLSLSGKILYVNEPAYRYLNGGHGKDCEVFPAITELLDQMTTALISRNIETGLAQLEAQRLIRGQEAHILLQVFGIGSGAQSRVVVTIRANDGVSQ